MSGLSRLRLVARALATTARVPIRRASTNSEGFWWERIVDHHHKWENAAWGYRQFRTEHSTKTELIANGFMAVFWWWFLTHVYYQWDILAGHARREDPRKYTDAELGIPPDEAD